MLVALAGVIAGLLVAAPPTGPLTAMFYRRLVLGRLGAALAIGVAAAISDIVYAALALFGYEAVLFRWPGITTAIRIVGVSVVVLLGLRYAVFPPPIHEPSEDRQKLEAARREDVRKSLVRGLTIAFLNPSALLTWVVVADAARTIVHGMALPTLQKIIFPLGVGLGVMTWFGGVALVFHRWFSRFDPRRATQVTRFLGLLLLGVAAWYGLRALQGRG